MARVFPMDKLDGFWVDRALDRCLHIGWESEDTLYLDLFDSASAAYNPERSDLLMSLHLNIATGDVTTTEVR